MVDIYVYLNIENLISIKRKLDNANVYVCMYVWICTIIYVIYKIGVRISRWKACWIILRMETNVDIKMNEIYIKWKRPKTDSFHTFNFPKTQNRLLYMYFSFSRCTYIKIIWIK